MDSVGKTIIILGAIIVLVGVILVLGSRWGIGRLPGDIIVKRGNFVFFFPFTTSIVVSLILTAIFTLMRFMSKR